MNTQPFEPGAGPAGTAGRRAVRQRGILLVECLVYIAAFGLITAAAFAAFYRGLDHTRHLQRNTDDIARSLRAGERWRADVRSATGPLKLEAAPAGQSLSIPQPNGAITYFFVTNAVVRWTDPAGRAETLLPAVSDSQFTADRLGEVASWRWELELATPLRIVHVRPRFSFQAVPGNGGRP